VQGKPGRKRWYEAYVPFVVRSVESQIAWLIAAFHKGVLSPQEITPYIRLLLTEDSPGKQDELVELFRQLDEDILAKILLAADIHECPKLLSLISQPTVLHALIALGKCPAPYEKSPQHIVHKVFNAIYDCSEGLLKDAVTALRQQGEVPTHFEADYERFREIIEDQKLLSSLFPKAKIERGR